jgi:hypothetical protein
MKKTIILSLLIYSQFTHSQGLGIGANPPHASAELDVNSTTRGMLIPRMTAAQRAAITVPANGLMVYETTTNSFWFYNSVSWIQIGAGGVSPWATNGTNISNTNAGKVGIGTSSPVVRFSVDSSMMVDQANSNQGFLDRSSLYFGSDKKVGIVRSFLTGSAGRSGLGFFTNNIRRMTIDSTGQVGIGTINPLQALHVNGSAYFSANVGIGTATPDYAFENVWGYNHMFYGLGVGTIPNSTYMLDVGSALPSRIRGVLNVDGNLNANANVDVDGTLVVNGNTTLDGSLTVNGNKGVAYNSNSATNLKIYTFTTLTFGAVLPGFGLSAEGSIAFNGGFTGTPRVFVGDIDVTGGVSGELYRVQLQLYGCSTTAGTTSCKARLLNTSPNPVNYNITWNCMAIGN